jgi:ABC-type transport system involved in multi-copper enzyme maturation permease subunit
MKKFLGVMNYEFQMSIQRKGLLVIALLFTGFYLYLWIDIGVEGAPEGNIKNLLFSEAGQTVFFLNLFYPVIAGISAADRAVRDYQLGVREILRATSANNITYVLGKYFGVVGSLIVIELGIAISVSAVLVAVYRWPATFIFYNLMAVLVLSGPGLMFITAFSLACPLVMPVRVYQILFTGYWYWGNFMSSQVMFTISDTLLNASGKFALMAFFGVKIAIDSPEVPPLKAVANIAVLLACAGMALAVMAAYIKQSEQKV